MEGWVAEDGGKGKQERVVEECSATAIDIHFFPVHVLTSLIPRFARAFFHTASDRKLGRASEKAYWYHKLVYPFFLSHTHFLSLMASCCYKLLENPAITRDRAVREKVFHLMGMLIKKYNQALSTLHFSIP